MAVYEHGIDADAVLTEYPQHRARSISETSHGVNLPLLRRLITRAAGKVNDALARHGYSDPETQLTDSSSETCKEVIINSVIGKAILFSGAQDEANVYLDLAKDGMKQLHAMPENLGTSQPSGAQVASNIDVTRNITKRYGRDFKGW